MKTSDAQVEISITDSSSYLFKKYDFSLLSNFIKVSFGLVRRIETFPYIGREDKSSVVKGQASAKSILYLLIDIHLKNIRQ